MRKQRGRREDSSLRWAFKYVYRREPTKAELEAYAWDRHIERLRSFPRHWLDADDIADLAAADAAGAKAAPPAERPPTPVPAAKTDAPSAETRAHAADKQPGRRRTKRSEATESPKPASSRSRPPKRRGRPPRVQQALELLQRQLADGWKPGALVEAAAQAAEIPKRELLAAADVLGVRTRKGQWWIPGA